jgi:hypothetical protein
VSSNRGPDRINILTPEVTDKEIGAVPTVAGEKPGMGEAMGACSHKQY